MRNVIFFTIALISSSAGAGIAPQDARCYRRLYSEEHMAAHPGQKLSELFVKLAYQTFPSGYKFLRGEVVGVAQGSYFGNTAPCTKAANGELLCAIECDGGAFRLQPNGQVAGNVNFRVKEGYWFPLYLNRMARPEDDRPTSEIQLTDAEPEDRLWRLEPADVRDCDRAIQLVSVRGDGGC